MCKTMLIRWSSLVTFFSSLKFSICVCHFGIYLLIWPVTLSRENIEIILYVQNPVEPLIQPSNFFFKSEIFNMCVSFWRWFVDFAGNSIQKNIEIILYVQNPVDLLIQPGSLCEPFFMYNPHPTILPPENPYHIWSSRTGRIISLRICK